MLSHTRLAVRFLQRTRQGRGKLQRLNARLRLHTVLLVLSLLGQRGSVTLPGLILLSVSLCERRP